MPTAVALDRSASPVVVAEATPDRSASPTIGSAPVAPAPVAEATPEPAPAGEPTPDTPKPAGEPTPDTPKLEVIARLVEPQHTSHCGYFHFVVVMRYEIVEVLAGSHAARDLFVAHSCPELVATPCKGVAGERVKAYKKDELHHMKLESGPGSGSLIDKFADKTARRYRSRCATLVTAPATTP